MNRGIPKYVGGEISRDINCYGLFLAGFPSHNFVLFLMNFTSSSMMNRHILLYKIQPVQKYETKIKMFRLPP
jgi:hypothetical protein